MKLRLVVVGEQYAIIDADAGDKAIVEGVLPSSILNRMKEGGPTPIGRLVTQWHALKIAGYVVTGFSPAPVLRRSAEALLAGAPGGREWFRWAMQREMRGEWP